MTVVDTAAAAKISTNVVYGYTMSIIIPIASNRDADIPSGV